jgi:hypothetical protein
MFVQKSRYLWFEAVQAWWPQSLEEALPLLGQTPVVLLWQCPESLALKFRRWTFRARPFHTPIIDLGRSEEQLWQKLEPKSCRYEIRKAQKLQCAILRNQETEAARALLNESIGRLQYRPQIDQSQWQGLLPDHDIFLCTWQGMPVVVHQVLRGPPQRARLILSGSADRNDPRFHGVVGPCNRLLHWHELLCYKAQGYRVYDFGGCVLDKDSSQYPITQFKVSFGAEVVAEPHLYLAKNPARRALLRGLGAAQRAVRRIPWPQAWLKAVRSNPFMNWTRT